MIKISVVMPAFNKARELNYVLSAYSKQSIPPDEYEIIIIDDGSEDKTSDVISNFAKILNIKSIYLPRNTKNTSQAYAARNMGINSAQAPIVVIVDSDIIPSFEFLENHISYHNDHQDIAVLGFTYAVSVSRDVWDASIIDPDGWDFINRDDLFIKSRNQQFIQDKRSARFFSVGDDVMSLPLPWTYFWSHNLSVSKRKLLSVGLFDETFRRSGDFDLGYRLFENGTKFVFARDAEAFHYPHPRDFIADLTYDREGENYFLRKFSTIDVEALVAFGCYEASPKYLEIEDTVHRICSSSHIIDEFEPIYFDFPKESCPRNSLILGCGSGKLFGHLRARAGCEVNSNKLSACRRIYENNIDLYALLGIALPFANKAFSNIIITDFWRFLPIHFVEKLIEEAVRVGEKVILFESDTPLLKEYTSFGMVKLTNSEYVITNNRLSSRLMSIEIVGKQ